MSAGELSPWLVLIALGAFHGLNPAMGWLFAVALGLYRQSRKVVLVSLIPIALGHAAAIAVVVYAVMALGMAIDAKAFRILSGVLLIAWGVYHLLYGHRHRLRIGLRTGTARPVRLVVRHGDRAWRRHDADPRADAARAGRRACPSHAGDELALDRLACRAGAQPRHADHDRRCRSDRLSSGRGSTSCGAAGSISISSGPRR